ncbi:MAG: methylated-DNA--[protein]-cysteine S-methyltransferase [Candidatus Eisenbacteria bacterium]
MKPATVHYGSRRTAWGRVWVALGDDGVLAVALGSDPVGMLSEDVRARRPSRLAHDLGATRELLDDLERYLAGRNPKLVRWAIDPAGLSEFRYAVYEAAREVPYGSRVAYKELARRIASARHAHAVGTALATNPFRLLGPDHRVILTRGAAGLSRLGRGWKGRLLALEAGQVALDLPASEGRRA